MFLKDEIRREDKVVNILLDNFSNHEKLNINQLNSSTCDKTHVNNPKNNEQREPLEQHDKKSESEEITEQINPNSLHKKRPLTVIVWRFKSETFSWKI